MNTLITKNDERFYHIDGTYLPRITWILQSLPMGEGLKRWLGNAESFEEAERLKMKAALRGTHVHSACKRLIDGDTLLFEEYTEEEWGYLESFVNWVEEYKPTFLFTEKTVHSKKYGYAGTFDCIAKVGDDLVLIDFKTSSSIYPLSMFSQCAAYANAAYENKLIKKKNTIKIAILQLGSRHKCGYNFSLSGEPWQHYFKIFLSVKDIFHYENPKLEPSVKTYKPSLSLI